MPKRSNSTRRDFLKSTTAGAAAISAGVFTGGALAQSRSANEKLNIGCIGTANQARFSIGNIGSENIVAVCDIDSNYLERAKKDFPKARTYVDYRELLEAEGARIDASAVAIAVHNHAPSIRLVIRTGKHLFCDPSLTHLLYDWRTVP